MWFFAIGLVLAVAYLEESKGSSGISLVDSASTTVQDLVESASVSIGAPLNSWTQFDDLFKKYSAMTGVPWQWLKAFALNESSLGKAKSVAFGIMNPTDIEGSKSSDGKSWGLMQLTIPTAKSIDATVDPVKLNNPEYSIDLASQYIEELMGMFDSTDPRFTEYVVKSYNQGPGNTRKEIAGTGGGYSNEYWDRWQRNFLKIGA